MRYKRLPIEDELEAIRADRGDAAMEQARSQHVDALLRHPGFQIILVSLRDIEQSALVALREGRGDPIKAAARIHAVDVIRRTISGIVPQEAQPDIEWGDEEFEEFLPPDIARF